MGRFSLLRSDRQAPASGKARSDFADDENFIADAPAAKRSARQKEAPDPALPEKKRARRRLVGAITLTLAAAIALPLVFDPEPKPISQDISIDVPARNKTNPATAAEPAQAAPQPAVQEKAQASSVPAAPVAAAAVAGTAAVAAAANAKSAPAAAAKPAAETKPAASEQGKLIVQVAALGSQQKAAELQARLKSAGIASHIQKVDTRDGQRLRVRIGPLANKKEADGVCAKLDKMRLQCTLVPA